MNSKAKILLTVLLATIGLSASLITIFLGWREAYKLFFYKAVQIPIWSLAVGAVAVAAVSILLAQLSAKVASFYRGDGSTIEDGLFVLRRIPGRRLFEHGGIIQ